MDFGTETSKSSDSLKKESAELSDVEDVLFTFLNWRALDSQAPNPILGCPYAKQTLDRCLINQEKRLYAGANDQRWVRLVCNRHRTMDRWIQEYLDEHSNEDLQVIHMCCGLDARNLRVKWGENVRWIDIDTPAVVDLRNRVMPAPEGDYSLRSLNVLTDGWFRDIPSDRKTVICCQAFLLYVEDAKVKKLFRDLVDYFGTGQIIHDTGGTLIVKHAPEPVKKSNLKVKWAVDDARDIEKYHPNLKLVGRVRWQEYMGSELPLGQNLPPIFGPWTTALLALRSTRAFKDLGQVLKFAFGDRVVSVNSSELTIASEQSQVEGNEEIPEKAETPASASSGRHFSV